jgi:hypothetical protein
MHDQCGCRTHHENGECGCGHHGYGHFKRHFMTKTEKIEKLENYAQDLKNEIAAVTERIKELKSSK